MKKSVSVLTATALLAGSASPAFAAKKDEVQLQSCEQTYGSIAVVDGDTQGWTEHGLGSPRELINAMAVESGCFTPHNPSTGQPADFLLNVIGGSKEEIDKSVEMAKSAAMDGLVRSGVAGNLLASVPMGGALLGMFGGLGGKKKQVAAAIKVLNPATGQTITVGSGEVKKTTLSFGGAGALAQGAQAAGYSGSKDGRLMAEAFMIAFNAVAAQGPVLQRAAAAAPAAAPEPGATVAIDTILRQGPSADSLEVRTLRAGTELTPAGGREGLFIEVEDNYGTKGWVSVEHLG